MTQTVRLVQAEPWGLKMLPRLLYNRLILFGTVTLWGMVYGTKIVLKYSRSRSSFRYSRFNMREFREGTRTFHRSFIGWKIERKSLMTY